MAHASPEITTIRADIAMPARKPTGGRGSRSSYPFDKLEIGQSFGVKNKTAKQLASIVSAQNKRYTEIKMKDGKPVMHMAKVPGTDKRIPTETPERIATRKFRAVNVDPASDPDNASVRVYRVALG